MKALGPCLIEPQDPRTTRPCLNPRNIPYHLRNALLFQFCHNRSRQSLMDARPPASQCIHGTPRPNLPKFRIANLVSSRLVRSVRPLTSPRVGGFIIPVCLLVRLRCRGVALAARRSAARLSETTLSAVARLSATTCSAAARLSATILVRQLVSQQPPFLPQLVSRIPVVRQLVSQQSVGSKPLHLVVEVRRPIFENPRCHV